MQASKTYQLELTFKELRDLKDAVHLLAERTDTLQIHLLEEHKFETALEARRLRDRYRVLEQKVSDMEFTAWHEDLLNEHLAGEMREANE